MPESKTKVKTLEGQKIVEVVYEQGHVCFIGEDGVSVFSVTWQDLYDQNGNNFDVTEIM